MEEKEIGKVTHFFGKINVGIMNLSAGMKIGDKIHVKGVKTDFEQTVDSMQVNHKDIKEAKPGDDVGLKLSEKVREGDKVYIVTE